MEKLPGRGKIRTGGTFSQGEGGDTGGLGAAGAVLTTVAWPGAACAAGCSRMVKVCGGGHSRFAVGLLSGTAAQDTEAESRAESGAPQELRAHEASLLGP